MSRNSVPVTYRDPETGEERQVGRVLSLRKVTQSGGEYYQVFAQITDDDIRERLEGKKVGSVSFGTRD